VPPRCRPGATPVPPRCHPGAAPVPNDGSGARDMGSFEGAKNYVVGGPAAGPIRGSRIPR